MNFLDLSLKVQPRSGYESLQGQREYMEDRVVCFDDIKSQIPELNYPNDMRISYFGVFDGHAGSRAAEICKNQLHTKIICESLFQSVTQSIQVSDLLKIIIIFLLIFVICLCSHFILKNGINAMDEYIVDTGLKEGWSEGSCLSIVLLVNNTLYAANLGDSHIVLGRNLCKIEALQLSETHKASEKAEKERITKAGGMVMRNRVFGDLSISRAMGDLNYKKPKQTENFVSNIAYIKNVQLTPSNHFVIIASDGLWDKYTNLEAVELIYEKLKVTFKFNFIQIN